MINIKDNILSVIQGIKKSTQVPIEDNRSLSLIHLSIRLKLMKRKFTMKHIMSFNERLMDLIKNSLK